MGVVSQQIHVPHSLIHGHKLSIIAVLQWVGNIWDKASGKTEAYRGLATCSRSSSDGKGKVEPRTSKMYYEEITKEVYNEFSCIHHPNSTVIDSKAIVFHSYIYSLHSALPPWIILKQTWDIIQFQHTSFPSVRFCLFSVQCKCNNRV